MLDRRITGGGCLPFAGFVCANEDDNHVCALLGLPRGLTDVWDGYRH